MHSYATLHILIQELESDAHEIGRLRSRNAAAWTRIVDGANDPIDWGALGFTIQTLYGVLESYLLRISNLQTDLQTRQVREVLRFRHRLRHLYGEDLDPLRTSAIQHLVQEFFDGFPKLHASFVGKLRSIADAL